MRQNKKTTWSTNHYPKTSSSTYKKNTSLSFLSLSDVQNQFANSQKGRILFRHSLLTAALCFAPEDCQTTNTPVWTSHLIGTAQKKKRGGGGTSHPWVHITTSGEEAQSFGAVWIVGKRLPAFYTAREQGFKPEFFAMWGELCRASRLCMI